MSAYSLRYLLSEQTVIAGKGISQTEVNVSLYVIMTCEFFHLYNSLLIKDELIRKPTVKIIIQHNLK